MSVNKNFKARLRARAPLVGCFVKTPHPTVIEVLGVTSLDFLVLDAEHSPFDRGSIDACLLAARAVGCAVLVRVPEGLPSTLLGVLDSGAAGVVVPHVKSVEQATAVAQAFHYGPKGRGIAGTTRAGKYGAMPLADHRENARDAVSLICQIEDEAGAETFEEIAALEDVDALFVGRADLSQSFGEPGFGSDRIDALCGDILGATEAATGLFVAPGEDAARWRDKGASLFIIGSDHSMLQSGAKALRAAVPADSN